MGVGGKWAESERELGGKWVDCNGYRKRVASLHFPSPIESDPSWTSRVYFVDFPAYFQFKECPRRVIDGFFGSSK